MHTSHSNMKMIPGRDLPYNGHRLLPKSQHPSMQKKIFNIDSSPIIYFSTTNRSVQKQKPKTSKEMSETTKALKSSNAVDQNKKTELNKELKVVSKVNKKKSNVFYSLKKSITKMTLEKQNDEMSLKPSEGNFLPKKVTRSLDKSETIIKKVVIESLEQDYDPEIIDLTTVDPLSNCIVDSKDESKFGPKQTEENNQVSMSIGSKSYLEMEPNRNNSNKNIFEDLEFFLDNQDFEIKINVVRIDHDLGPKRESLKKMTSNRNPTIFLNTPSLLFQTKDLLQKSLYSQKGLDKKKKRRKSVPKRSRMNIENKSFVKESKKSESRDNGSINNYNHTTLDEDQTNFGVEIQIIIQDTIPPSKENEIRQEEIKKTSSEWNKYAQEHRKEIETFDQYNSNIQIIQQKYIGAIQEADKQDGESNANVLEKENMIIETGIMSQDAVTKIVSCEPLPENQILMRNEVQSNFKTCDFQSIDNLDSPPKLILEFFKEDFNQGNEQEIDAPNIKQNCMMEASTGINNAEKKIQINEQLLDSQAMKRIEMKELSKVLDTGDQEDNMKGSGKTRQNIVEIAQEKEAQLLTDSICRGKSYLLECMGCEELPMLNEIDKKQGISNEFSFKAEKETPGDTENSMSSTQVFRLAQSIFSQEPEYDNSSSKGRDGVTKEKQQNENTQLSNVSNFAKGLEKLLTLIQTRVNEKVEYTETDPQKQTSEQKEDIAAKNHILETEEENILEIQEDKYKEAEEEKILKNSPKDFQESKARDVRDKLEKLTVSKKKGYSVYEDWRLLETIEDYLKRNEKEGLRSIKTWTNLKDPLTKRKLFDSKRSAESMRYRACQVLAFLTDKEKDKIKEFTRTHSNEEAIKYYCKFKKNKRTGQKKFAGIFPLQNFSKQKPNTVGKASVEISSKTITGMVNAIGSKGSSRVDSSFEETKSYREPRSHNENIFDAELQGLFNIQEEHEKEQQRQRQKEKPKSVSRINDLDVFTFFKQGLKARVPKLGSDLKVDKRSIASKKGEKVSVSKKRKTFDGIDMNAEVAVCSLKKIKLESYYEQKSLRVCRIFGDKRKKEESISEDIDDVEIYVDLDNSFRQFVKEENSFETYQTIMGRLMALSKKYKVPMEKINYWFCQVSEDIEDLENYLVTKNPCILWDSDEDKDLKDGNETAIRYLGRTKGEVRIQKRRKYLCKF